MAEYILPSGAVLTVTPLPYGEAFDVTQMISREVDKIDLKLPTDVDFKDSDAVTKYMLSHIDDIKSPICKVISSTKVLEAAHKCMKKCTYNGLRIVGDTFDPVEARKDFILTCFYALKENVSPFLEGLLSSLSAS